MSKRDDKQTAAEDYLAQLEWQNRHRRRQIPARGSEEPRWKYKILYSYDKDSPLWVKILGAIEVIGLAAIGGFILYQAIFRHSSLAIYIIVLVLFIGLLIFFAIRDAAKPNNQDHEE